PRGPCSVWENRNMAPPHVVLLWNNEYTKATMIWTPCRAIPRLAALLLLTCMDNGPVLRVSASQRAASSRAWTASSEALLPPSVKVVWELGKAYREKTPTRD